MDLSPLKQTYRWLVALGSLTAGFAAAEVARSTPSAWEVATSPWAPLLTLLDRPAVAFFLAAFFVLTLWAWSGRPRTSPLVLALTATLIYLVAQVVLLFFVSWSPESYTNVAGLLLLAATAVGILRGVIALVPQVFSPRLEARLGVVALPVLVAALLPWQTLLSGTLTAQERDARAQAAFGRTYLAAQRLIGGCSPFRRQYGELRLLTLQAGSRRVEPTTGDELGVYTFGYATDRGQGQLFVTVAEALSGYSGSFSALPEGRTESEFVECERLP